MFEANVTAGYQLIRFAVPELIRQGEGIAVFFGSGAADSNLPRIGVYAVAKAAEEHLARQLAAEAPEITSFVYRPGVVETRMQQEARKSRAGRPRSCTGYSAATRSKGYCSRQKTRRGPWSAS